MSIDVIFPINGKYVSLGNIRGKQAPAQTPISDAACIAWGFEHAMLICGGTPPPIPPIIPVDTRGEASAAAAAGSATRPGSPLAGAAAAGAATRPGSPLAGSATSGAATRPRSPAAAAAGIFPEAPSPVSSPHSRSPSPIIDSSQFSRALRERLSATDASAQLHAGLRRRDVPADLAYVRATKLGTHEAPIEVSPTHTLNYTSKMFRDFIRDHFPRIIVSWGRGTRDESPIIAIPPGSGVAATVLGSAPPPPTNISTHIQPFLKKFLETLTCAVHDFNSKGIILPPRWSLLIAMHQYVIEGEQVRDHGAHMWNLFPPCLPVQSKPIDSTQETPWHADKLGTWLFFDTSSANLNFWRPEDDLTLIPEVMTSFLLQHTSPLSLLDVLIRFKRKRNHTRPQLLNHPWVLKLIGAIITRNHIFVPEEVIALVVARSTRV